MDVVVVTSVLDTLAPKIFAFLPENHFLWLSRNLERDIRNIRYEIGMIDAFIKEHHRRSWRCSDGTNDAEELWIQRVRDLAYSMQDCMDSFLPKLKGGWLKNMSVRTKFAKKIRELRKESEVVSRLREKYTVGDQACTSGASPPTSEVPEPPAADLVGIGVPREELLERMREDEGKEKQLKVISIVGLGGLGKTVLARQVYDSVGKEYEPRVWVRASEMGAGDVLSEIHRQVHDGSCDNLSKCRLSKCLGSKRFLIVIDDMRKEDCWNKIKYAFPKNMAVSSRVIVTTANQSIANACSADNGHVYVMRTLDEEHSKRLFFKEASSEYYAPAEQVLKKCDGLPLALVTTAQLLQSKCELTPEGCANLCRDLGKRLEKEETLARMKHALLQSYYSLPGQQEMLFLLYLGIFPSGRPVRRKRLIRRWLAEGFVEADNRRVAINNFENLMKRSIIQHVDMSNNTEAKTCQTHGMVLEFILHKSMCDNFITLLYDHQARLPDKIRWLSLHHNGAADRLKTIDLSIVRSLTIFGKADEHVLEFSKYELLRVLDLEECETLSDEHVKNICNLLRLRYLSLGGNITMLPKEISKLKFLETLDVRSARENILPIPIEVIKLPCLIHLLGKFSFQDVGKEMEKLQTFLSEKKSNLETLAGFVADQSPAFPQLMSHMNRLKKVKVWCEPTADGSNSFTHLSGPLQDFIQRDTQVMDGRSLSLSFEGCSQDFLDFRHEDNCCYLSLSLSSLKLQGELQRLPPFVTKLGSVTELCLSSPDLLSGDVLAALSNVRGLHYLKLITRQLDRFVIKQGELKNLRRLCIVVQSMACLENQEGALPQLESLWLLCKGLNGLCGAEIEHLTRLKEVALDDGVSEKTKKEWKEAAKKHLKQPRVSLRKDVDQNRMQMGVGSEPREVSESRAAPSPEVADIQSQVHRGSEDPAVHKKPAGMLNFLLRSWGANCRTSTVVSCSGSGQDGVTKPPENGPCKPLRIRNDMDDAEGARARKKCRVCEGPHSRGQCDQHLVDTLPSGEQVRHVPVGKRKKRKNPSNETPVEGTHAQILQNQQLILNTVQEMKTAQIEFQNETHNRLVDMQMTQNDFQDETRKSMAAMTAIIVSMEQILRTLQCYTRRSPPPSGASNPSALAVPPLAPATAPLALAPVHQDPAPIFSQDPAPVPPPASAPPATAPQTSAPQASAPPAPQDPATLPPQGPAV